MPILVHGARFDINAAKLIFMCLIINHTMQGLNMLKHEYDLRDFQ